MIKLVFRNGNELLHFMIKEKNVYYTDRLWGSWMLCLPRPVNFVKEIIMSRNKYANPNNQFIDMFKLSEEDKKEYDNAKGEEELSVLIIRDAKLKGCVLVNKEVENGKK